MGACCRAGYSIADCRAAGYERVLGDELEPLRAAGFSLRQCLDAGIKPGSLAPIKAAGYSIGQAIGAGFDLTTCREVRAGWSQCNRGKRASLT